MKIKQLIFVCCSLVLLLTSCNNYLDVKPKGKIIPKTAEEYSTLLHYWLDEIEKGVNSTIVPDPEHTSFLELSAEDLDGTLSTFFLNTQLYAGSFINSVIWSYILSLKIAMSLLVTWKMMNQKLQKQY